MFRRFVRPDGIEENTDDDSAHSCAKNAKDEPRHVNLSRIVELGSGSPPRRKFLAAGGSHEGLIGWSFHCADAVVGYWGEPKKNQ